MAKKTFKNNPALRFISTAENTDNAEQAHITDDKQNTEQPSNADNTQNANDVYYTDNKQERKSKRLNLLIQPSILENLSKIAHMKQTSVNDLISSVLKDYIITEDETISMYNKVFVKK